MPPMIAKVPIRIEKLIDSSRSIIANPVANNGDVATIVLALDTPANLTPAKLKSRPSGKFSKPVKNSHARETPDGTKIFDGSNSNANPKAPMVLTMRENNVPDVVEIFCSPILANTADAAKPMPARREKVIPVMQRIFGKIQ